MEKILEVTDLEIAFTLRGRKLKAIRGVSFDVIKGESLTVVGESGAGKSVLMKSLMGLLEPNASIENGSILFKGKELTTISSNKEWLGIRGKQIAMVMQDPMTSLNPLLTIGYQIRESILLHSHVSKTKAKEKALDILHDVGIDNPEKRYTQYPHEFSGGMRQRVVIAIALACTPDILICDEPTTALDVTIQAQILALLKDLKDKYNLTTIYITHDLGVVANVADRVAVMYAGDIIEIGLTNEIFYLPAHPYTWALLSALPQLAEKGEKLYSIAGTPPNLYLDIVGDAFAPRNPYAMEIDFVKAPSYFDISDTHRAKTWLLDERAPKIQPPKHILDLQKERGIIG